MALTLVTSGGEGFVHLEFSGAPAASDNTLVAAAGAGKSICVFAFTIIAAGTDNAVYFKTGTTTHFGASGAAMTLNAAGPAGGVIKQFSPVGHFTGGANELLALTASTTQPLFGSVTYKVLGG